MSLGSLVWFVALTAPQVAVAASNVRELRASGPECDGSGKKTSRAEAECDGSGKKTSRAEAECDGSGKKTSRAEAECDGSGKKTSRSLG
jgi:hypothetical protein